MCLASGGMRGHLRGVRRIIIDELHSVVPSKRGVDLMLSVERLSDWVMRNGGADPQRIGLSATIAPLERMAEYLVGADDEQGKDTARKGGATSHGAGFGRSCALRMLRSGDRWYWRLPPFLEAADAGAARSLPRRR